MKNLAFYAVAVSTLAVFIPSCSTPKLSPTQRVVVTTVLDFRQYNEEGFFVSSTPYVGLYDPVGQITVAILPAKSVKMVSVEPEKNRYSSVTVRTEYVYENEIIATDELLEIIVSEAKKLGADGIVSVRLDETGSYHYLTGLAIKRK